MTIDPRKAAIDAVTTLRQAASSGNALVRSNALEAMAASVGAKEGGTFVQYLGDSSPSVQFAAAMAIGDTQYQPAMDKLKEMAKAQGPDKRVYPAVIYALFRLGDYDPMQDLARLIRHPEPAVRAVTAQVFGKIGERTATRMLLRQLQTESEPSVEVEMVVALASLGHAESQARLEGWANWPFLDDRLVAIPALARILPGRALLVLPELAEDKSLPVRLAAIGGLAQLGRYENRHYKLCVQTIWNPEDQLRKSGRDVEITPAQVTRVQQLAARALGYMNRPAAVDVLHPLLGIGQGSLRVTAAASILRLLPTASYAGPRLPMAVEPDEPDLTTQPPATAPDTTTGPATMPATVEPTVPATMPAATQPDGTPAATEPAVTTPQPPQPATEPARPPQPDVPAPATTPATVEPPLVPPPAPATEPSPATEPADENVPLLTPSVKPKLETSGAKD